MPRRTIVEFKYETFTPAEAEAATGVSVVLQRSYRRRNYIPGPDDGTHARFTAEELGRLAVLHELSQAGVQPAFAVRAADLAAFPIAQLLYGPYATGGSIGPAPRFVVVADEGTAARTHDLNLVVAEKPSVTLIVVNLDEVARRVLQRLPRPAIVEIETVVSDA